MNCCGLPGYAGILHFFSGSGRRRSCLETSVLLRPVMLVEKAFCPYRERQDTTQKMPMSIIIGRSYFLCDTSPHVMSSLAEPLIMSQVLASATDLGAKLYPGSRADTAGRAAPDTHWSFKVLISASFSMGLRTRVAGKQTAWPK